jgi:hypothetical protein
MALFGCMTRNETVKMEACKWYSRCLRLQQLSLGTAVATNDNPSGFLKAMIATYLLAVFENTMLTSSNGWIQHFTAAVEMILLKGPAFWQKGLASQVFRSLRIASVRPGRQYCVSLIC